MRLIATYSLLFAPLALLILTQMWIRSSMPMLRSMADEHGQSSAGRTGRTSARVRE